MMAEVAKLSSGVLKRLIALQSRKEKLVTEVSRINRELSRLSGQAPGPALRSVRVAAPAVRTAGARPRKRGRTGRRILRQLKQAGTKGCSVQELSEKLKIKAQNLYVWFNSTGRKIPQVKKIGVARYAYLD